MRGAPGASLLVLLMLLLPAAAAQTQPGQGERVDVTAAEFPPSVLADRPFYINVTLHNNDGAEQRITLFATMYDGSSATPCEGSRAQQTLSKFQKSVTLAPGQTLRVEGEATHWAQVVNRSRVTEGTFEVCVWARLAQCPQQTELAACFLDYQQVHLAVKLTNAAPRPSARADPAAGTTGAAFRFTAQATDADGDEVRYAWDFGDGTGGSGAQVTHAFARAGNYTVTLNATDGFDSALATVRVQVAAGGAGGNGLPGFEAALLAVAALIAAAVRGRRLR